MSINATTSTVTANTATVPVKSKRIKAIDILRGITVAGMILVNNPGSGAHVYPPLQHAEWNGLTPTDLIFPSFIFIMGVSMYISLSKRRFQPSVRLYREIFKRTILLILIGWLIGVFGFFLKQWPVYRVDKSISFWQRLGKSLWYVPHMRILGVFPRLGLTYGIAACLTLQLSPKKQKWTIFFVLLGYTVLLLLGNGYEYGESNILSKVDRAVLTRQHMYYDNGIEPEGLLSTIPAVAEVMLGVLTGSIIMNMKGNERLVKLFANGTIIALIGYLLNWWMPTNKKIWSPSFVLVTSGISMILLALLIYLNYKHWDGWATFFLPFGMNPLFIYLLSTIMILLFLRVPIYVAGERTNIYAWGYHTLLSFTGVGNANLASFLFAFIFMLINWCIGYILYRKKIYIKL